MKTIVFSLFILMVSFVSARFSAGWTYNPLAFYPYTAIQAPVQETPEVAAARANHLAAHAAASRRVVGWNSIQDTPEVWAAKVEHYRAHQAAATANGVVSKLLPLYYYNYGVPQQVQDTPEVQAAKAEFFRAYNAALARSG